MPRELARQVTEEITIPTNGIGAGVDCSGQILVLQDMLDLYPGKSALRAYLHARPTEPRGGRPGLCARGDELQLS